MEDLKSFKNELQNIILGDDSKGTNYLIKTVQAYLKSGTYADTKTETKQLSRAEEERALIKFAGSRNLWLKETYLGIYITEGAEQKVYFPDNANHVIKIADGIFYTHWLDYFNNLLLHNFIFANTAYELIGFLQKEEKLFVVIKQPYVTATEITALGNIKEFLLSNGFKHTKNNDYYHPGLGIILEDLHDENVLTNNNVLFFVDTVFYLSESFYLKA